MVTSYRELELAVGETIVIGDRRLTLLDIEGELGLFQLDQDDEYTPLSSDDLQELLTVGEDDSVFPR